MWKRYLATTKKVSSSCAKKHGTFLVLSLSAAPTKLKTLLQIFDYKNENTFRDNYIKPLREMGFLRITFPEKPTEPENKYIITEQGKGFLTGTLYSSFSISNS